MRISSIVQDSFAEYEGEHALTLFCNGCNLRCPECYNLEEVLDKEYIGTARDLIDEKITPMHTAVVFLGGEPTVWAKSLIADLIYTKNSKGLKTKVFTNGMNPKIVAAINKDNLADAWSIDIKCVRGSESVLGRPVASHEYIYKVEQSIDNILSHGKSLELRTTLWDNVTNQKEEIDFFVQNKYPSVKHIWQPKFSI